MMETRVLTFQNGVQVNLAVIDRNVAVVQTVMGGLYGGVEFGINDRSKLIKLARENLGAFGEVVGEMYCYTDDAVGFTAYFVPAGDSMTNMKVLYRNRVVYDSVVNVSFTNLKGLQTEAHKVVMIVS